MYGLSSREALSKRQSRWVQEVDKEVRSNPAQNSFNREPPPNLIRNKSSIISMMNEDHDYLVPDSEVQLLKRNNINHQEANIDDSSIASLQSLYDELQRRCIKLEQNYESLRQSLSDKSDLVGRIQKLEETSARVISSNEVDSSEFSALTEPDLKDVYEFVPYVIKEEYAGRDNLTVLTGLQLDMLIELIGAHLEPLVLYPFGMETRLPEFLECSLQMTSKDHNPIQGILKRRGDGVYIINLDETKLKGYTFPLILNCKTKLVLK